MPTRRTFLQGLAALFALPMAGRVKGAPVVTGMWHKGGNVETLKIPHLTEAQFRAEYLAEPPYYMHKWNQFGMCEVCGIHDMTHRRIGAGPRPSCLPGPRA